MFHLTDTSERTFLYGTKILMSVYRYCTQSAAYNSFFVLPAANSLDPVQDQQIVGSNQDPNPLTLLLFKIAGR